MSITTSETALSLAIARRSFTVRRHGYDQGEVEQLLDELAARASDLVREADLAVTARAAVERELVEVKAELGEVRAELASSSAGLTETHIGLVEAEAARTAAERALAASWEEMEAERAARTAAEERVAELETELQAMRSHDQFSALGDNVAAVLRAAHQAADDLREVTRLEVESLRRETDELVGSMVQEAEDHVTAAREQAASLVNDARAEADHIVAEASAAADQLRAVEHELRQGLETAASWLLKAANEPLAELPPPAGDPETVDLR